MDLDYLLNGKKKGSRKKKSKLDSIFSKSNGSAFNMDKILPKKEKPQKLTVEKDIKQKIPKNLPKETKIEIHNHYHGYPSKKRLAKSSKTHPRRYLSTFESVNQKGIPISYPKQFIDKDGDGVPSDRDPNDYNPNIPKPMTTQRGNKRVKNIMNDILGED